VNSGRMGGAQSIKTREDQMERRRRRRERVGEGIGYGGCKEECEDGCCLAGSSVLSVNVWYSSIDIICRLTVSCMES
jgi:hypothetical protein